MRSARAKSTPAIFWHTASRGSRAPRGGRKKALTSDIKEVYGEAKANGFDVKIMRKIVSIRKQDRDSRIEEETVLDLYLAALGMN